MDDARKAAVLPEVDVRHAVRAQITTPGTVMAARRSGGLLDDLLALAGARWLQAGLAGVTVFSGWSLAQGAEIIRELDALWSLGGPLMSHI